MARVVAGVVVLGGSVGLGLLAGGLWLLVDDVCGRLALHETVLARLGHVGACSLAVTQTLQQAEHDRFVFDVAGDHAAGQLFVRSARGLDGGLFLHSAALVVDGVRVPLDLSPPPGAAPTPRP